MRMNSNSPLMRSLLVLSMTVALAATVHAQGTYDQGRYDRRTNNNNNNSNVGGSIQITFASPPRWIGVPGTRVRQIQLAQSPDYDMFRYGGVYYVYNNDQWYMSRRPQGRFFLIEDRQVPRELYIIPRDHWQHYPPAWGNRYDQGNRNDQNGNGRGNHGRGRRY
jgi:hypothetical protein